MEMKIILKLYEYHKNDRILKNNSNRSLVVLCEVTDENVQSSLMCIFSSMWLNISLQSI